MVGPPPSMTHHPVKELRMLKILDRRSGICLFTEQWKWHPHAHAEGVDALVQSFTQFAREIDGGEVMQVHFNPTMGKNDPKIADDRRPSSGPMQFTNTTGAITMISTQTAVVQAVLFHDRTAAEPVAAAFKVFLQKLVARFDQVYRDQLANLRPQLEPNATLTTEQHTAILGEFVDFKIELDAQLIPALEGSLPKQ
uniref:Longin domain-containing protein n=1 Tax=Globisporangium ultimum (strain ATCC 200006 / CBS 805.95 / DAOM BR144) TaxID=431595 RepID=K3WGT5_GLOUD